MKNSHMEHILDAILS